MGYERKTNCFSLNICNNGYWTKYLSVRLSERKTSEKKSSGKRGGVLSAWQGVHNSESSAG